jgi:hypothetical protein
VRVLASLALVLGISACSFNGGGVQHNGDDDVPPIDSSTIDSDVPPDACVPTTETCNGNDDDCDGNIDEDVSTGAACDGPDADLCMDDAMICDASGNPVCSTGTDTPELCGGGDEDCDGNTDEGFTLNVPCDGTDGDMCLEGVTECTPDGTGTQCNDATDTIVETCNHADDDCDTLTDETFNFTNDQNNCGDCGIACTNSHGTTSCASSACAPVCSNGAAQCDGDLDDGCELVDTNPVCLGTGTTADITVNGDAASSGSISGTTERFVHIHLVESQMGGAGTTIPITGRIQLTSGAGTDWDLYVYCPGNCGGTPMSDPTDSIDIGRDDAAGDRSYDVIAEVRYDSTTPSTTCASWTLTVTGNVSTTNRCAN